jgi:adenylosuccinate lyase
MIDRYSLPEMKAIWELQHKYDNWLKVELAIVQAQAEEGRIPREAAEEIRRRAESALGGRAPLARALEIEKTTRHDMLGFVGAVLEHLGEAGRFFHYGVTSYDVEDCALSLQLCEASDLLLRDLDGLIEAVKARAREHRETVMIGRTHAIHAEPITLGFKLAIWVAELMRHRERLLQAREMIAWGKVSGAVGTHANVSPQAERRVCEMLGLQPSPASTQILQRDRHGQFVMTLALLSCSLEKFATEIRNLQRTEVREVEEAFARGQRGSSAMPHKRNPWVSEQICGLARVVRGYVIPAMENVVTWHERDLANSSVERVIFPDTCILLDYQLQTFTRIVREFQVYPEAMKANLEKLGGLVFSEQVMLALIARGESRDDAYKLVQELAMQSWEGADFKALLLADPSVRAKLSPEEIERCFDLRHHLRNLDHTFEQLGI